MSKEKSQSLILNLRCLVVKGQPKLSLRHVAKTPPFTLDGSLKLTSGAIIHIESPETNEVKSYVLGGEYRVMPLPWLKGLKNDVIDAERDRDLAKEDLRKEKEDRAIDGKQYTANLKATERIHKDHAKAIKDDLILWAVGAGLIGVVLGGGLAIGIMMGI